MNWLSRIPAWQKTLASLAIIAAGITAFWNFADAYGFRPALKAEVEQVETKIATLDRRALTWQLESLKRQRYAARRACKRGDRDACDEARDLDKAIERITKLLTGKRGF